MAVGLTAFVAACSILAGLGFWDKAKVHKRIEAEREQREKERRETLQTPRRRASDEMKTPAHA